MNQDQVKQLLQSLAPVVPDFTVIFTGKRSSKVNGLYKPLSREILLHNKNFTSDSLLVYTAVHELAHHVHFCSAKPPNSSRAHTKAFWLIFHELLLRAEAAGHYKLNPEDNVELHNAIKAVKTSLRTEAEAIKASGMLLLRLKEICEKAGVRFEDVLDRHVGISRQTHKIATFAATHDMAVEYGPDHLKLAAKVREPEILTRMAHSGAPLIEREAKARGYEPPEFGSVDAQLVNLEKEETTVKKTITRLSGRLNDIRLKMEQLKEGGQADLSNAADAQMELVF